MAFRKRGVTFLICFRKLILISLRKGGVPTLEETMNTDLRQRKYRVARQLIEHLSYRNDITLKAFL